MNQSTLQRYALANDILVVHVQDTSAATLQDWYISSVAEMDAYTGPVKRLYDMRDLDSISIEAVRTAVKIRRHPHAHWVYTAVLTSASTVAALVKASMSVKAGGNFKLFTDKEEAVTWLNRMVP